MDTRELTNIVMELPDHYMDVVEELREFNQSYIQSLVQMLHQEECEDINELLFESKRIRKAFSDVVSTPRDYFCYEFGVFNENFRMLQETLQIISENEEERKIRGFLSHKHVKEIIQYLHENPYARQGTIAETIGVKPNYLSEILNKMLVNGLVDRYGKHKSTQYCLTREGRKIYRTYFPMQQVVQVVYTADVVKDSVKEKKEERQDIAKQIGELQGKEEVKYAKRNSGGTEAITKSNGQLGAVHFGGGHGYSSKDQAIPRSIELSYERKNENRKSRGYTSATG